MRLSRKAAGIMTKVMTKIIIGVMAWVMIWMVFWISPAAADVHSVHSVHYVHQYTIDEYFLGEQQALIEILYTEDAMYTDRTTRYTGSWMKRIFGKVKEERFTAQFLLKEEQIREVNWYRNKVLIYPLDQLADTAWIPKLEKQQETVEEILKERYEVAEPELILQVFPETETIEGYPCRRIRAELRMKTIDKKKNSQSITEVFQDVWVSEEVPGLEQYHEFHRKLGERIGLDAQRLGKLNLILRYWKGSLDPIRDRLDTAKGYPVKHLLTLDAIYVSNVGTDAEKTVKKRIKTETMVLKSAVLKDSKDKKDINDPGDPDIPEQFFAPEDFIVERVDP